MDPKRNPGNQALYQMPHSATSKPSSGGSNGFAATPPTGSAFQTTQAGSTQQFGATTAMQEWDQIHGDSFRVVIRLRPLSELETSRGDAKTLRAQDSMVIAPSERGDAQGYQFNCVFDGHESQETVFQSSGVRQMIDMAMEGYATTIFAFGQTGSGKTYTISGPENPSDLSKRGLMARTVEYIYSNMKPEFTYKIRASYLEIYNEQVRDLLNMDGTNLGVRWSSQRNAFYVENLLVCECSTPEDLTAVVEEGMKNRTVGSHVMNKDSSRSHGMLTIHIDIESSDDITHQSVMRFGKISFVDLAGSEKVKETKSSGDTLKETQNINRSLFCLGVVISTLGNPKKRDKHIPYRDSKLTKLLMDSLGGNGATLMIACCSPSSYNLEESLRTLMYASRAKNIKNKPIVQMDPRDQIIMQLRREIQLLRAELEYFKGQRFGANTPQDQDGRRIPNVALGTQSSLSSALEMARGFSTDIESVHSSKSTRSNVGNGQSGNPGYYGGNGSAQGSMRRLSSDLSNLNVREIQASLKNSEELLMKCMQENEKLVKDVAAAIRSKELAEKQFRSVMEENDRLSQKLEHLEDIFLDSQLPEEASKWGLTAPGFNATSKTPTHADYSPAAKARGGESHSTPSKNTDEYNMQPRPQQSVEYQKVKGELERSLIENAELKQTIAQWQQKLARQERETAHRLDEQTRHLKLEMDGLRAQLERMNQAESDRQLAFEEFKGEFLPPNPQRTVQEENQILRTKIKDLYNENKYLRVLYNDQ